MENLFKVVHCEELGDYVIADKNLVEGQIILNEQPLISFPTECTKTESGLSCVGCFRTLLPSDCNTCRECKFPICSYCCSQEMFHSELECKMFAEKGIRHSKEVLGFLKFVRVFESKNRFPERYQKFQLFASEIGPGLEKFSSLIENECMAAWKFLTETCQMDVTVSDVKNLWAAWKINSFLIDSQDESGNTYRGYALFEKGCKFSHGCFANVEWFFVKGGTEEGVTRWDLRLHCTRAVKKGEVLSIAYTPAGLNYGTGIRNEIFQKELPFDCLCSRCVDATEEGTFFSAHKCLKCKRGYLLPENPLSSFSSLWKCSVCTSFLHGVDLAQETKTAEKYIKRFISGDLKDFIKDGLDSFIDENSGKSLHPNHFLIFQSTLHWLNESDFAEDLIVRSKSSAKLFQKILSRYSSCISLAKKTMPTLIIAELELTMVNVIAAFAFKSTDCVSINAVFENPRLKLRFSRLLLKHLTRGRFWMQKQPNYHCLNDDKDTLDERYTLWTRRCKVYSQEILAYQMKLEENGLLQLRFFL